MTHRCGSLKLNLYSPPEVSGARRLSSTTSSHPCLLSTPVRYEILYSPLQQTHHWLPHTAQQVLATCHETFPLSELAAMADRILAVTTSHAVNLVQHSATSAMQDAITALQEQVASLTTAVERMAKNSQRGRSRTCSQPHSRAPSPANPGTCFYHARYGDKAHRCEGACTYKASGNALARQ